LAHLIVLKFYLKEEYKDYSCNWEMVLIYIIKHFA